jgi:hypothetical protein
VVLCRAVCCFQVELDALRTRAQQEQRAKHEQQAAAAAAAAARASSSAGADPSGRAPAATAAVDEDETTELLKRTVKVTWDSTVGRWGWGVNTPEVAGHDFLLLFTPSPRAPNIDVTECQHVGPNRRWVGDGVQHSRGCRT